MIIYGVALLSVCLLLGLFLGNLLGAAIGVQANVGGVGMAMVPVLLRIGAPKAFDTESERADD